MKIHKNEIRYESVNLYQLAKDRVHRDNNNLIKAWKSPSFK
jgi:hypothetical protein